MRLPRSQPPTAAPRALSLASAGLAFTFALAPGVLSCSAAPAPTAPPVPAASSAAAPLIAPSSVASSTPAAPAASSAPAIAAPKLGALEQIRADAKSLEAQVQTPMVKRFLAATAGLPAIAPRALYHDEKKTRYFTEREAAALSAEERGALRKIAADEELYYNTRYGSPLSYSRALDILFASGLELAPGAKVLDFGYGYAGHLRLLASLGVDATGVDVDPMLRALYSEPGDQGEIPPFPAPEGSAKKGRLRLLNGKFPADPAITRAVGAGYDLVISKNVLKKGYIHPDRPAQEKHLIRLEVSDEVVLKSFFAALKPGGKMLVYNICPAPSPPDKPFIPWSDGRSPFTRQQWEAAGFKVLVFDQDDAAAVRVMGRALGWDKGEDAWDIERDLSVLYTLVERPAR
jgi:SAM-dependent methyltransferase